MARKQRWRYPSCRALADNLLAVVIRLRRVDEGDAGIDGGAYRGDGRRLVDRPHGAPERPGAEPEDGNAVPVFSELPVFHGQAGTGHCGVERRHQLVGEQVEVAQPGLLVVPVEPHDDEGAERPGLLHQLQQPAQHLVDVAGDDLLRHPEIDVAVGIRHVEVALEDAASQALVEEAGDVLVVAADRVGARQPDRLRGGVGEEDGARDLPAGAVGLAARFSRCGGVGLPVVGEHVAGGQGRGERGVAALPGDLETVRVAAEPRHGDRRVRLLQRLVDEADRRLLVDEFLQRELPELPVVLVGRVRGPELQDHVERLQGHGAPLLRVEAVELLVGGDAPRAEAEVEAAVGEVVEEGDPGRHVRRGGAG